MSDSAYYIPNEKADTVKLHTGEYEAIIDTVETTKDVKCGGFIADIFKPVYTITDKEHGKVTIKDNGVFRYKEKQGYQFQASRNWGYSKYLKLMQLEKARDNGTGMIAPLKRNDIIHNVVIIDVFEKSFTNDFSQYVRYNVARTIELIAKGDIPF